MKKIYSFGIALLLGSNILNAQTWHKYTFNSGNADNDVAALNNGTVTGATLTTDRFGNPNAAYDFGTSGAAKIDCGDIAIMNNASNLTITGWFQKPTNNTVREMFCKPDASGMIRTRTYNDFNELYGYSGTQYTGAPTNVANYTNIATGTWFHFALIINTITNSMKTYINGVQFSQGLAGTIAGNLPFIIGNAPASISNAQGWQGKLDDIYIVNRSLSVFQIDSIQNLPDPNYVAPPLEKFCYSFNTGTSINDCDTINNGTYIGQFAGLGDDHFGNVNKAYYCGASAIGGVNCGDISLLNSNNDFSIAGWVQLISTSSPNTNRYIFSKGNLALYLPQLTSKMVLTMGGQTLISSSNNIFANIFGYQTSSTATNHFAFFAVTRQGNVVKLYNSAGAVVAQTTYTAAAPSAINTNFVIGYNTDMKADDIIVINRCLSSTQIDSLRNLPNPIITTRLIEKNNERSFTIYPNPANDILNIKIPMELNNTEIKIYNQLGQMKKNTSNTNNKDLNIEIAELPNGLYYIFIQNGDKQLIEKFTINR